MAEVIGLGLNIVDLIILAKKVADQLKSDNEDLKQSTARLVRVLENVQKIRDKYNQMYRDGVLNDDQLEKLGDPVKNSGIDVEIEETQKFLTDVESNWNKKKRIGILLKRAMKADDIKSELESRSNFLHQALTRMDLDFQAYAAQLQQAHTSNIEHEGTQDLRVVIVGMTGIGKSALGNSILGHGYVQVIRYGKKMMERIKKPFKSESSPDSVTSECQRMDGVVYGQNISIVDTPGLFDTRASSDDTLDELMRSIFLIQPGPHAILLVISVDRFTDQVLQGVQLMRTIFGDEYINFLIIVFTHVDNFLDDDDDDKDAEQRVNKIATNLDEFVRKIRSGPCRDLLEKSKMRYIGVNNKFKITSKDSQHQVKNLLTMVNEITKKNSGSCYTQEFLTRAQEIMKKENMKTEDDVATCKGRDEGVNEDMMHAVEHALKSPEGQELKKDIKKKSGGCFGSDSEVRVQDSQGRVTSKSLKELVVDDLVQSYDQNTNSVMYTPIYYMIYQDDNETMSSLRELFYQGIDGRQHSLRIHKKHLIYATINPLASMDPDRVPSTPTMSENVNVGDVLWVTDDDTCELCPRRVLKIGEIVSNVRHPMTMNHTIIVDGVLASVHTHNEWILRQATAPLRLIYNISPSLNDLWLSKKAVEIWDYVESYILDKIY